MRTFTFKGRAYYRSGRVGDGHALHALDTVVTVEAPSLRIARQLVPAGMRHVRSPRK
jgi:hypothetical protein